VEETRKFAVVSLTCLRIRRGVLCVMELVLMPV